MHARKNINVRTLDLLIWIFSSIVLLWGLAKMFGLINTPIWLQQVPVVSGVCAVLLFFIRSGRFFGKIESEISYITRDMKILKIDMKDVERKMIKVESKLFL